MARFKSALDSARREAQADFQRALSAASRGQLGSSMQALAMNSTGMSRVNADARQRVYDAREQYTHFRGQIYTSIRPICQRIAGQPIRLGKIAPTIKGRQQRVTEVRQCDLPLWVKDFAASGLKANEDFQIVDQHEILDALNRPAASLPGWNDWSLKYSTVASLELTGYSYWYMFKAPQGGRMEILTLPSHWVRPIHGDKEMFTGWQILPLGIEPGFPVGRDEIAPFWYPDPADPTKGFGPLEAGAKSVMVEEFVIEAQKRSFQLGIHPSAVITVGSAKLDDGKPVSARLKQWQRDQVTQAINSRYRGLLHYSEPIILDRLISDIKPYGNKPSEMDFGTNADSARARVEQIFGTNPYTAGAAGLSSRAESAESDRHFVGNTVNPKIELISRVLTIVVLPQFDQSGRYVLFIEPARAHDAEMEQKEAETGLKYGCMLIDEYRTHYLRLPPLPNGMGQKALVPTNMAYVEPGGTVPAPPPKSPADATASSDDELGKAWRTLAGKAFDDTFYDAYATAWLKSHGDNESTLSGAVEAFLNDQGDDVVSKLEALDENDSATADDILTSVFDEKAWDHKFRDAVTPAFAQSVAAGAEHELKAFGDAKSFKALDYGLGFDFGVDLPPVILSAVKAAVEQSMAMSFWADVQQTTRDAIKTSIQDSIEAGESPAVRAKRVRDDVFGGNVTKDRAENIARSESTFSMNAGQDAARQQLASEGVVTGKAWFATFDGATRSAHLDANGQKVGVNENFEVGGESAKYPGDPALSAKNRCRCRCVASSVTPFSKLTRAPRVKSILGRGCEIHGSHH